MRFFAPVLALLAATAVAQSQFNMIDNGSGTLTPSAGNSETITWTNPSSGTVTIKIQPADPAAITPDSGTVLLENVQASAGSATVTIPADAVQPNVRYVYQIIDNTNSDGRSNANYSFPFLVTGAEGTASSTSSGTASRTTTSASITSGSSTSSESDSSTMTGSESSSTVSGTRTTTGTNTRTSTSTSGTASPTTAPGSGSKLAAQGGLFAVMFGAAIVAL